MGMRGYIAKRLVYLTITILVVMVFNFLLFRVMPGDPVRMLEPHGYFPPEKIEEVRRFWGLDQPLHIQFLLYLKNTLAGDLGLSIAYMPGVPVTEIIMERIWNTVLLCGLSAIISIVVGILLGVIAAWKRGKFVDVFNTSFGLVLYSMPTFWLGLILTMVLGTYLQWFPVAGIRTVGAVFANPIEEILDVLAHLFLPALTYTLGSLAGFSLIMRQSLIDVFTEDYIVTARAKGLKESDILRRHAVPNAMLPTVTNIAYYLAGVIGGAVVIETIFAWPGIGLLTYYAVGWRDYTLLQGIFFIFTIAVVFTNFITDIVYTYLDPRVRLR